MTTPVPASRGGTPPPPVRNVPNRPPVAPGMGPSRGGTPPPNTPSARRAARGGQQGGQQRKQSRPQAQLRRKAPPDTAYQNVILGEFIGAVLLVAATPFAKKDQPGLSPYAASDVLQLVAITVLYFVLALVSSANPGAARFAAWFGGLILLTVGLGEAARLAMLLDIFGLQQQGGAAEGSAGPILRGGGMTA